MKKNYRRNNKKSVKQTAKHKFDSVRFTAIKIAVAIVALLCISMTYFIGFQSQISDVSPFEVRNGTTVSSVASDLRNRNMILSENLFKASVLFFGGRIQTGEYELPQHASTWKIAKMFANGDIAATNVILIEGMTVKQIKAVLKSNKNLTGDVECSKQVSGPEMPDIQNPYSDICNLKDGDIFPDTYRVSKGTNRLAVLKMAHDKMEAIRTGWENSGRFLPKPLKSWDEVITLASIVQKETPKSEEMPIVASVYINRLNKHMKLQADPTVVYALTHGGGDMHGRALLTGHLKTNNAYNTYMHYGLPPTPIANVGQSAIAAVLAPEETDYLFFVADGQGGHKFATTYADHQKNHADWRLIKKSKSSK